jgi:hypothetical protein
VGKDKNIVQRFAPFIAVPDGTKPLFGTRLRQALKTIKNAWNGKPAVPSGPDTTH